MNNKQIVYFVVVILVSDILQDVESQWWINWNNSNKRNGRLNRVSSGRRTFPDQTDDTFQNECLQMTNSLRAQHHAPNVQIDQRIVDYAKSRCRRISRHQHLSHGHSGLVSHYGENLYWGANSADIPGSASQAIKAWYSEVNQYDFGNPGFSGSTGHFTQVVWKSTNRMGCARCGGREGQWYETYVVCNYAPRGNIVSGNYFRDNVLPK